MFEVWGIVNMALVIYYHTMLTLALFTVVLVLLRWGIFISSWKLKVFAGCCLRRPQNYFILQQLNYLFIRFFQLFLQILILLLQLYIFCQKLLQFSLFSCNCIFILPLFFSINIILFLGLMMIMMNILTRRIMSLSYLSCHQFYKTVMLLSFFININ